VCGLQLGCAGGRQVPRLMPAVLGIVAFVTRTLAFASWNGLEIS